MLHARFGHAGDGGKLCKRKLRIVASQDRGGLQCIRQSGKRSVFFQQRNRVRNPFRGGKLLFNIGGIAVDLSVHTAPEILYDLRVHNGKRRLGRADIGKKILDLAAVLCVHDRHVAPGGCPERESRICKQTDSSVACIGIGKGKIKVVPFARIRHAAAMEVQLAEKRRSLGVVLQDVNLFTGTVMDNIRYGKLDATDEECIAAAKLANAHDFITRLPEGYNTMLTANGANLSQGQRQLLSIARAAVADPPVMILDEATSSIDTRTEALVQKGMDALMEGRTVFVIAHRLSTVRNSDAIMVLDHGRIIERGSHDDLIAAHGTYYRLYTGAFELE